jgi:hypothetical protein
VRNEIDLEQRLFRIFRLRCKRDVDFHFDEFYEKLLRLVEVWRCSEKLKAKVTKRPWLARWCRKYDIVHTDKSTAANKERSSSVSIKSEVERSELAEMLDDYGEDEIYLFFCFHFCWSSLPDRSLGAENSKPEDNVWLLMAANRSGRHRTRVCVLGKEMQPACLEHVNMLSQPVVYASSGDGPITSDLFAWWFYHEFSPGALAINHKVALLVEDRSHLTCDKFVSEDSRAKFLLVGNTKVIQQQQSTGWPTGKNAVEMEFRVRYAKLFFSLILVEERNWSCQAYISRSTLKDVFPLLHKAWLTIRIETFERQFNELLSVADNQAERVRRADEAVEDGKLLLELQWIAHDLGLEISDQDLVKWAYTGEVHRSCSESAFVEMYGEARKEVRNVNATNSARIPSARDAAVHLNKALAWMETQPFDPHFLLFIRHLIVLAKQA